MLMMYANESPLLEILKQNNMVIDHTPWRTTVAMLTSGNNMLMQVVH
jgi:hypothetical protein